MRDTLRPAPTQHVPVSRAVGRPSMFRSLKNKASKALQRRKRSDDSCAFPPETDETVFSGSTTTLSSRESLSVLPTYPPSAVPPHETRLGPPPDEHEEREPEPERDPFTPRYVPFVDASPLKNNMFASQASYYGAVNASIMGGFGGDDESIWLVDDEETDEEVDRPASAVRETPREEEHTDAVPLPGPAPSGPARPAFQYRSIPGLLDDTEFTTTSDIQLPTSVPTPGAQPEPARPHGYAPISSSILGGFDPDDEPPQSTGKSVMDVEADQGEPAPRPSTSTNPYVALFEQHEQAMTVAYLRRLDQPDSHGDDLADDFSFGQRYQRAVDTSDVVVTHQRVPATHLSGERDCVVCAETKPVVDFPRFSVTGSCTHSPATCLECIETSIRSDLDSKVWTDIRCPECREPLEYADIQRYADQQTFTRYEGIALRDAMAEAENFFWCTSNCGSGQLHDSGTDQPIVTCLHCGHRSCFEHKVAWHQNLTCDEYNRLLADPEHFRSQMEIDNDEWERTQQAQMDADMAVAQGLLAEEREEVNRREAREREERERAKKASALARQIAARRKREEEQSQVTVNQTTRPCPGCGWAIEKNRGCSHMTCAKCRHEFCYECGADHRDIVAKDNSIHKESCRFHPSQLDGDA